MSIKQADIKYNSKDNIIVVKALVEGSKETMIQTFNQISELSEIENCKNVLIDAINTTKLPEIFNLHSVGTYISKHAVKLSKMRLALAISDEISDDFRFFDTVLANRMVNIKIFKNVAEAKDWLLNKE